MEYRLLRVDADRSIVVRSGDLGSEIAAITWARKWLKNHAVHDRYRLESAVGDRPILMIHTVAGQWYAMPIAAEASGT
jgi:hypothetical protein